MKSCAPRRIASVAQSGFSTIRVETMTIFTPGRGSSSSGIATPQATTPTPEPAKYTVIAIVARRGHDGSDGHPVVAPMSRLDALLDACHKRARPIVMTTLAMGAGMLPLAAGWSAADASFRSPMAVAVIGGLMTSTVLSLLVVPSAFTVVDDLSQWLARLRKRARLDQPAAT